MSGANHPGSSPTIHQCLEDEACGILAAVVGLSQSVMVFTSLQQQEGGGLSGGHGKRGRRRCCGKITQGFYLLRTGGNSGPECSFSPR